ncbi:lipopolysaccharide biosynthesis protein, partial [Kineococcus rubinsiae]|uniref:lipopolysaccharide biosynthesis protein n=1 Tax=Kineococcus rubinsiae TaxID=2609562 RepID=UPI00142F829F
VRTRRDAAAEAAATRAPDAPRDAEAPEAPAASTAVTPAPDGAPADAPATERPSQVRSVVHLLLAAGVLPLVSLATGPLLARVLGLEGRGHLSAVLAPVALVPYLLSFGLGDGAAYLVARRGRRPGDVALVLGGLGAAAGALGAAVLWLLAPVLLARFPEGIQLLRLLGLTLVPAMALSIIQATRVGEGRYDLLAAERWISGLSRLAVLLGLAVGGALTVTSGAWAQVGVLLVAQCTALVALSRPRARWREANEIARSGVAYGSRAWGGELSVFIVLRLDQTVMLPLAGASQLGLYVVAVALAEVPTMLLGDLRRLLLTEVAATRDARIAARACRLALLAIGVPVVLGMAATPFLIPLLFGSEFAGAVPMAVVLLGASMFSGLNLFLGGSISALGRPGAQSAAQAASLVVAVLSIGLIAPFGGMGAAWGSLASYLTGSVFMLVLFRRLTGERIRDVVVPRRADAAFLASSVLRMVRRR